jgi:hypothetical protein
MQYTITVNRGNIGKSCHGGPAPCIRVQEAGVPGERYVHEVHISGPVRIGPIAGKLIGAETDGPLEEVLWHEGSHQNS